MTTFRVLAALAFTFAAGAVPISVHAQDNVHLRNDCRLASQILRTGHPAPHGDWAWTVIPSCADSAGAVLASVWRDHPSLVEPSRLWGVSHRVRDARLTRAVIVALRDQMQPREVRTVAARVLGIARGSEIGCAGHGSGFADLRLDSRRTPKRQSFER